MRFYSHLSGGLRLRNYRAVAGNHKFSSRFSVSRVFVAIIRWLLNGVVELIFTVLKVFVRRYVIIELTYRKEFATCC